MRLDLITRSNVKEFVFQKIKKMKPNAVRNLVKILSGILTHAVEDEIIEANPVGHMGKFIPKYDTKANINPLSRKESQVFLDTVKEYYPRYYEFFLTALRTGLRLGELIGLHWGDIDFHGRFIEVRRNYVKGEVTTPKNHHLRRVDMSNQLTKALKRLRTKRKSETLKKGWKEVPEWVFINNNGHPLNPDNLRPRVFTKALEKARLRKIRIHDLRHTYASLLIQQSTNLVYVKEQMGHHSISITVDIYGHLEPGADRAEVDKLDDATIRNLSATTNKKRT